MEQKDLYQMTNEELLVEKKKMMNTKVFSAAGIGILIGIITAGVVAWFMNPKKNFGLLLPMLLPIIFIYRQFKKPNQFKELEELLKQRGLK